MGQLNRLGELWCRWMHTKSSWPMNGRYQCLVCGRQYVIPWANYSGFRAWPVRAPTVRLKRVPESTVSPAREMI